jgi:hypothetical protein
MTRRPNRAREGAVGIRHFARKDKSYRSPGRGSDYFFAPSWISG